MRRHCLFRWLVSLCGLLLCSASSLCAQGDLKFFPISEVRAGLRGVGRTVFEGDKVEDFQVEILGVLKNALAPKHDIIIARLSGGPLEKTGVIAGMSGSPVYIDGKLLGAVALSFPFSKEPLTGITPIDEMLQVVPAPAPPAGTRLANVLDFRIARTSTNPAGSVRLVPEEVDGLALLKKLLPPRDEGTSLASLSLPLRLGGFSSEFMQPYMAALRSLGFEPMLGGSLAGSENTPPNPAAVVPGSMISLLLVRGDFDLNVDCTVTYRQGDNLYACGHRVLMAGPTDIPFAQARVLTSVPSIASSFKLDAPGPLLGTIRQDRFSAIYGAVGDKAQLIPVHVQVDSTLNKKADYKFEVVQEPFLTPLLVNLALGSALSSAERMLGPSTLEIKGAIQLATGESVNLEDLVSSDVNNPAAAASAVAVPLGYLMGSSFRNLRVTGIDLSFVSQNEKRQASLEQVWSTQSEVRPGDHIEVTALLRGPSGEAVTQKIPIVIPESVSDKSLSVVVGGGASINALQFRFSAPGTSPRDLSQLLKALNRMRRNNRLYALLMAPQRSFILQGDEYPSPPPSLVQTFLADPAASSSVIFNGTSVVGDFETKACPYTIQGQKTLLLKVVNTGA